MHAHDEHGVREFRKAPRAANASDREGSGSARRREPAARQRDPAAKTVEAGEGLGGRVFRVRPEALEQLRRRIEAHDSA